MALSVETLALAKKFAKEYTDSVVDMGVPYITTAPTSDNTSGKLIFVVLASEPQTRYAGYFYIILGA